ncbi:MAG TPA: protein kinase [Kofleriaceae bacterium]|nr:protein kinase [Kofleriaceae bacterium]
MAPPEPTGADPLRIGRYEVISHLATGGMAQIYLARQSGLGSFERHVVLKTILRERASDQRFVTMFLDEARLAATLNHQNVAQVYEVDQADGAYFMAMEYVHGENTRAILETTIRRGWTIPLELAVMIISGAAAGLHHAHERRGKNGQPLNIVHRDVSPANIMVGYDGSVKVLDFGIAKAEERATKTIGGTIKGKYGYMSPEQCKGKPIDRRSDIFALGIVLYELTTLRRAFKGNDDFETMKRIVAGDMVLPTTLVPGFPRELEAIILTALAGDPVARFQTAQELIEALDAFTVRAKLTGSNTAMGRFMLQLFGTKKEPWIDAGAQSTDHTLVTQAELSESDDDPDENDETQVLANRQDVQRALGELNVGPARSASSPSLSALPAGRPTSRASSITGPPAVGDAARGASEAAKRPSVRRMVERPSLPFATPSADRSTSPTAQVPAQPQAMPLGSHASGAHPMPHPSGAHAIASGPHTMPSGTHSVTPVSGAHGIPSGAHSVPPASGAHAASVSGAHPAPPASGAHAASVSGAHPMPAPASPTVRIEPPRTSGPNLAATIIGPVPVVLPPQPQPPPVTGSGLPALVPNEDLSDAGARPLVTDPKLGWETHVQLATPSNGGHTRLAQDPSEMTDYRIRSNALWVVISVLLALVVATMIILVIET